MKRILKPSLNYVGQDEARKNTILRLVESLLNYCLYFILIYWILSILGLPVSSLLAGAGIAGVAIGMGAQGFLSDFGQWVSLFSLSANWMLEILFE